MICIGVRWEAVHRYASRKSLQRTGMYCFHQVYMYSQLSELNNGQMPVKVSARTFWQAFVRYSLFRYVLYWRVKVVPPLVNN